MSSPFESLGHSIAWMLVWHFYERIAESKGLGASSGLTGMRAKLAFYKKLTGQELNDDDNFFLEIIFKE